MALVRLIIFCLRMFWFSPMFWQILGWFDVVSEIAAIADLRPFLDKPWAVCPGQLNRTNRLPANDNTRGWWKVTRGIGVFQRTNYWLQLWSNLERWCDIVLIFCFSNDVTLYFVGSRSQLMFVHGRTILRESFGNFEEAIRRVSFQKEVSKKQLSLRPYPPWLVHQKVTRCLPAVLFGAERFWSMEDWRLCWLLISQKVVYYNDLNKFKSSSFSCRGLGWYFGK